MNQESLFYNQQPQDLAAGPDDMYQGTNPQTAAQRMVDGTDNIGDFNMNSGSGSTFMQNTGVSEQEKADIIKHIDELKYAEKRDNALLELSRQREHFSELAPFIWHSVGTIAALL